MPISAAPTARSGMLRLSCLTRACAGAAGGSRRRACGRTGLALRQTGRKYARPPRRRRHRRLVARGRGFDRCRGAVRRSAGRRSPDAAGAAMRSNGGSATSPTARSRRCSAPRFATMPPGRRPSSSWSLPFASPPASTPRCSRACCRRPIPNAFALPGGKVYLFNGLLAKADNADEIAGVLAHELGHLKHRDSMRRLIHNGGTSFLIGLLFGDITGSSALIFGSRTLVTSSLFARGRDTMPTILPSTSCTGWAGRRSRPGNCCSGSPARRGKGLSIISTHPLSEDRLARMSREDRSASGPPLLDGRGMAIAEIDLRWQV